ncbi:MAG TPA: glycosyltransferase, partial [Thermoanaerobaculia bacterium]|nr:glycosyltransferase [Thermoanaerobaculia bacterium]
PTAAAARTARRLAVPYVITPRGMLVGELLQRKSRLVKNAWISFVERRNLAHAAAVHFTSKREWDDASALKLPLPHPLVIPNGINPPQDPPSTSRDTATILFVGRINWKKGLDRLIAALALLEPGVRLEMAGNDEENYTPSLLALAESRKVSGRISFLGPVDSDAKSRLLRGATLLVLPSYSENFGNVVLEAMAEALPVVVTPEVGLASDVADAQSGVVANGDPQSLADAIAVLLADATRRSEMGARGRSLVLQRFTWARVAEEMEAAYEEIARRRP